MNRYASGYTLVSLISIFGWGVVAVSLVGGLSWASSAPEGLGYIGFIVAVSGVVQGIILLGIGAIGLAILDGSVATQRSFERQEQSGNSSSSIAVDEAVKNIGSAVNMLSLIAAKSLGKPGLFYVDTIMGKSVFKAADGKYEVDGVTFSSMEAVKSSIKNSENTAQKDSLVDGKSVVYRGYFVPWIGDGYLINGLNFQSAREVANKIDNEIRIGGYKIKNYQIL